MASFPGSIYSPTNPVSTNPRTSPSLSAEVAGLNDEIIAVETFLGTNGSNLYGGVQFFSYAGDPNGHVTTSVKGSFCVDTSTPALYQATATGNSSWELVGGGAQLPIYRDDSGEIILIEEADGGSLELQTSGTGVGGIELNVASSDSGGIALFDNGGGGIVVQEFSADGGIELTDAGGGITLSEAGTGGRITLENSGTEGIYVTQSAAGGVIVTDSTSGISLTESGNGGVTLESDGTGGITIAQTVSATDAIVIIDEGTTANSDRITLPNLPTSDPGVKGQFYVGAGNALFVSAG